MQFCNIFTFIVIGLFSLFFIIKREGDRSYSLYLMHWFFLLVFFFFTPLIQYTEGHFPLWLHTGEEYPILITNLFIITWATFYALGYHIRRIRSPESSWPLERLKIGERGVFVSVSLSIIVLITFLSIFGFKSLLIRGAYREVLYGIHPHCVMIIVDNFLKAIPILSLMGLLAIKERWDSKKQWWFLTGLLIFINLLVNNPLASSRYWAGIVVLGFILFLFFKKKARRGWVLLIIIIGILVLYPLSNELRNKTAETISEFRISNLKAAYTSPSFDAYEMGVHTVLYTERKGLTYGRQLLGPLLFWIPRSLWAGKPVGSGGVVARFFRIPYTNLSCPLPFEGYINFGILGLVLFAFGFGWLLSSLDEHYWRNFSERSPDILAVCYPFLLGFVFFIMRGDLMSGFSYTVMFIIAGLPLLIK